MEHNHTKDLTLKEQADSYVFRVSINETWYRFNQLVEEFNRTLNSGYCAFEMIKKLRPIQVQLDILKPLLMDLGAVEHYNFEAVLAQAEEG